MTRYHSLPHSHSTILRNNPHRSRSRDSVTLFSTDLDSSESDFSLTYESDDEGEEDDDESESKFESDSSFSSSSTPNHPHHKHKAQKAQTHSQRASFANMRAEKTATCRACGGIMPFQSRSKSNFDSGIMFTSIIIVTIMAIIMPTITATQDSKAPTPQLCMESIGMVLPLLRLVLTLTHSILARMRWFMVMVMAMPVSAPIPRVTPKLMPTPMLNDGMKDLRD
ncbi:hypothetical protein P168DRAFT_316607 [Aspergillus campestris IBT 28561]|uniref:Uncharacterized protein n=1 Tax=Aspergillus campestris (strain IBT 28561) TaxID=1392248 RepID=A0A2I1D9Q4_ASPC2|nr:uncharacterized protein P168DRAFT_316607 [Aspergillus campestris IBT 28561]PKY06610.1 hypothetical protein P168DRAFT_316607 [Aspergillus campestris IBT 28561]